MKKMIFSFKNRCIHVLKVASFQEQAGKDLWFTACRAVEGQGKQLGELTLSAALFDAVEAKEEDVYVSQKSNVGLTASYVARRLAEEPSVALALRSVGIAAQQKAVYACVIARGYVKAEQGLALWLRPREEEKVQERLGAGFQAPKLGILQKKRCFLESF